MFKRDTPWISFSNGTCSMSPFCKEKTSKKPTTFLRGIPCFSLQGLHLPENFVDPMVFEGKKTKHRPHQLPSWSLWTCLHHRQRSWRWRLHRWAYRRRHLSRGRLSRTKTVAGSDGGQRRSGVFQQKHTLEMSNFSLRILCLFGRPKLSIP